MNELKPCEACNGEGIVFCELCDGEGCKECDGSFTPNKGMMECYDCEGTADRRPKDE